MCPVGRPGTHFSQPSTPVRVSCSLRIVISCCSSQHWSSAACASQACAQGKVQKSGKLPTLVAFSSMDATNLRSKPSSLTNLEVCVGSSQLTASHSSNLLCLLHTCCSAGQVCLILALQCHRNVDVSTYLHTLIVSAADAEAWQQFRLQHETAYL